jgi:hypothetical protein
MYKNEYDANVKGFRGYGELNRNNLRPVGSAAQKFSFFKLIRNLVK